MDKCRSSRSIGQLSATLAALLALVALLFSGGALGPRPVVAEQETLQAEEPRAPPAVAAPQPQQSRPYPHWLYAAAVHCWCSLYEYS